MKLIQWRKEAGVTHAELAEMLGCTPALISQWELGKTPVPPARAIAIELLTLGKVTCEEECKTPNVVFVRKQGKPVGFTTMVAPPGALIKAS